MTIQELCEKAVKVLERGYKAGSGAWLDACDLTDLNILEPEVDKFCEERGYEWQVTSKPDAGVVFVQIIGDGDENYFQADDPDRATAILKALVAAGGDE